MSLYSRKPRATKAPARVAPAAGRGSPAEAWRRRRRDVGDLAPPPYGMLLLIGGSLLAAGFFVQALVWLG